VPAFWAGDCRRRQSGFAHAGNESGTPNAVTARAAFPGRLILNNELSLASRSRALQHPQATSCQPEIGR
jgi:hypothetical protein